MTKILYVEDNEDNVYMLSRRLKRKGFDIVIAVDGEQGVEMASTEKPDLILMDLSLPKMTHGPTPWMVLYIVRIHTLNV